MGQGRGVSHEGDSRDKAKGRADFAVRWPEGGEGEGGEVVSWVRVRDMVYRVLVGRLIELVNRCIGNERVLQGWDGGCV